MLYHVCAFRVAAAAAAAAGKGMKRRIVASLKLKGESGWVSGGLGRSPPTSQYFDPRREAADARRVRLSPAVILAASEVQHVGREGGRWPAAGRFGRASERFACLAWL